MESKKEQTTLPGNGQGEKRAVVLSFSKQPPAVVQPGVFFALRVEATSADMPRLEGLMVDILDHEGNKVRALRLMVPYPRACATDQVSFKAPAQPGTYTWTALFKEQTLQGETFGEARASFTFEIPANHPVSVSVWNVPGAAEAGASYTVRVGVKCSACCDFSGHRVRFTGEGTAPLDVSLGDTPTGASHAIYYADMSAIAPALPGQYPMRAEYLPPAGGEAHTGAGTNFVLTVGPKADLTVAVRVTAERTGLPVAGTTVALRPYRAQTNEEGVATLRVPKGQYRLTVFGQDAFSNHGENVTLATDAMFSVVLPDAPAPDMSGG